MNHVMKSFKESLAHAKNVLILTGSGTSAESGIPTFRGPGGFWRTYLAQSLATPTAFKNSPALVWEFYEYRRDSAAKAQPNKAHEAIANFEARLTKEGKNVTIVTQNIDGLHQRAGAKNVIELHGSLYKTRCTKCDHVEINHTIPICPALAGKGSPDADQINSDIPIDDLPKCKEQNCNGLLRPHVTWFGEGLESDALDRAEYAVMTCDTCLIIGTSSTVYPAAMFAPQVIEREVPIAEFNIEETDITKKLRHHFQGPCTVTVPEALAP